jgi:hypothetical protein
MQTPNEAILHPRDIGLILGYRCQAGCAHCLYNCGPGWHDWMRVEDVTAALSHAKQVWGQGFQVHLTGGEPFLNFPLLLQATRIAVDLDIPAYVETNAAWCRDPDQANDRFRQLRLAGLAAVLISVSPFHQAAIPLERTLTGITAAQEVFGASQVIVYQADWLPGMARHGIEGTVPLDRYVQTFGRSQAGQRLWQGYGLISGGRAGYRLGGLVDTRPPEAFRGLSCRGELLFAPHSHLDLYGGFIPAFCGGISLGHWRELSQLVDAYRGGDISPFVAVLTEEGPFGLYQTARKAYGYQVLLDGYAGKCHLCVDLRKHLVQIGAFPEHLLPESFYHQIKDLPL